jgi:hypothetical protein
MAEGFARDWDDQVDTPSESTGEFVMLDPGIYEYEVVKFEREKHKGSAKLPAGINVAVMHCFVAGVTTIKSRFYMYSSCDGLNAAFFTSCGLRKHGDPLVFRWKDSVGKTGLCKVAVRDGTGQYAGKQYNEIKAFMPPGTATESVTQQVAPTEPEPEQVTEEIPF